MENESSSFHVAGTQRDGAGKWRIGGIPVPRLHPALGMLELGTLGHLCGHPHPQPELQDVPCKGKKKKKGKPRVYFWCLSFHTSWEVSVPGS